MKTPPVGGVGGERRKKCVTAPRILSQPAQPVNPSAPKPTRRQAILANTPDKEVCFWLKCALRQFGRPRADEAAYDSFLNDLTFRLSPPDTHGYASPWAVLDECEFRGLCPPGTWQSVIDSGKKPRRSSRHG